jgi:DNA replication initiation complex subunit (GINS family)
MSGDEIGFGEISDVHRNERRSKVLTKLPGNFYMKAEEHLQRLRKEYDEESRNPSNPKAMMLQDDIKKLDKRIQQIYEMRERKIVLASLSGMKPQNMTQKDIVLFTDLRDVLANYRTGGGSRIPRESTSKEEEKVVITEVIEPQTELVEEVTPENIHDATVVQVLEDVPPFVDVDNTYTLKKDDIVTLPTQFADLLSSKGKVRIVDG